MGGTYATPKAMSRAASVRYVEARARPSSWRESVGYVGKLEAQVVQHLLADLVHSGAPLHADVHVVAVSRGDAERKRLPALVGDLDLDRRLRQLCLRRRRRGVEDFGRPGVERVKQLSGA